MKKVVPYLTYLGTRPPTVDEWDKYELHHRARLATKPGLTGMWQVSGRSNITDLINRSSIDYVTSDIYVYRRKRIDEYINEVERIIKRLL